MYPDLSYLFHDIIGTQPDNWLSIFKTFGFFLALSFLVAAAFFYVELKRKADEGFFAPVLLRTTIGAPAKWSDILVNALVGMLVFGKGAYAYSHFAEFRHDPAAIILSTKMNWLSGVVGALVFGGMVWYDGYKNRKTTPTIKEDLIFPHHRVSEMTVYAAVGGVLGAKIFDLFDNWQAFLQDPINSFLSGGGLAFYGGLILGAAAVIFYMVRNHIRFLPAADAVAPALAASYGFGRIGCQLSGDGDWGIVNNAPKPSWMSFMPDWLWSYTYPHNVLNTPHTDPVKSVPIDGCAWDYCLQLAEPVFPTPLYEILMMSAVVGILWYLRKKINIPGMLFAIYLAFTGIERFLIEGIRVNVQHNVLGVQLSQAQIISIFLVIGAVVMGFIVKSLHERKNV